MFGCLRQKKNVAVFGLVFFILIALIFYVYYTRHYFYESDAFIESKTVNIASNVAGKVDAINISDFQKVKAGQTLFTLDTTPYVFAVKVAKEKLTQEILEKEHLKKTVESTQYEIKQLQKIIATYEERTKAMRHANDRQYGLFHERVLLQREQQKLDWLNLKKNELKTVDISIEQAKENVKKAQYELENTTVRAPVSGHITSLRMNKGDYVHVGEPLFVIIDPEHWWVYARVKETELHRLKIGDPVSVWVSLFPHKTLQGTVTGIAWGVNRFDASYQHSRSALPYLVKEENWVKLAQRFPVRVDVDNSALNDQMRVGASVSLLVKN